MTKKERFQQIINYFSKHNPYAETELGYTSPYQLIVAVILSAQCTDRRVNMITPSFIKKFPNAESLARAKKETVYELIKSCSYPNNKTKHLIGMANVLVNDFNSKVPPDVNQLQKLPGIGRKSANVIASVLYNKPTLAVDTHVFRVTARLGLTTNAKNPLQAEEQLVKYIPDEKIPLAHHWFILHGRYVCKARKPLCNNCGLTDLCKYFQNNSLK